MHYIDELNPAQKEAAIHIDGPLAIIAGAGSGKTKVLTTRIAFLIEQGVEPYEILALTFTNKAAKEMIERVEKMLSNHDVRGLFIGTFHSVFARILRIESERIGYPRDFTIYDTEDSRSIIRQIIKDMLLDDKVYKPKLIQNRISSAKNMLINPQAYSEMSELVREDELAGLGQISSIYKNYVDTCFKNGGMDFDDLLVKTYELFIKNPDVLEKYQNKFKYVMIDEYQDTNGAQYHIIKLLAQAHKNLVVVGDDAQSIYSFRGATIRNILQFKSDYDNAPILKLEQNYRSTQNILNAANKIISNNKNQIPKNLWTEKDNGDKIKVHGVMSDSEEAKLVANTILEEKLRNHQENRDFAILYRTNAQSRAFEESLRRNSIPYRIYGGMSFYQRKEIKDLIAYLRILLNPQDSESLRRIINYPTRGIGQTTLQKLTKASREQDISLWETLENPSLYGVSSGAASKIGQFRIMIQSLQAGIEKRNAYEVAQEMARESGILYELNKSATPEDEAKIDNINELLNSIQEFSEQSTEDGEIIFKSLGSYLQEITLLTDADETDDDPNTVKLMTVHAAKGLEFPYVFIVGMEENLFPSQMSMYDTESLEEERRLFYVAVTRAQKNLKILYSHMRYKFGSLISNSPSRFISELPEDSIEMLSKSPQTATVNSEIREGRTPMSRYATKPSSNYNHRPAGAFEADDPSRFEVGDRVEHLKFGFGEIMDMEGGDHNKMASILFESGEKSPKKIMLKFAKLRKVN